MARIFSPMTLNQRLFLRSPEGPRPRGAECSLIRTRPLLPAPSSGPSDDRPVCAVAVITKPFSHHNERLC